MTLRPQPANSTTTPGETASRIHATGRPGHRRANAEAMHRDNVEARACHPRLGQLLMPTLIELGMVGLVICGILLMIVGMREDPPHAMSAASLIRPILRLGETTDGAQLWIRRSFNEVLLLDLQTSTLQTLHRVHGHAITHLDISRDGQTYLLSGDAHDIEIYRQQERLVSEPAFESSSVRACLSANGKTAVLLTDGLSLRWWDLSLPSAQESTFSLRTPAQRIAIDPQGEQFVAIDEQGGLELYNLQDGGRRLSLPAGDPVTLDPVISDDGQWIVIVRGKSVELINLRTQQHAWTMQTEHTDGFRAVSISTDGQWIATSNIGTGIQIIDRHLGIVRHQIDAGTGLHRVAFSVAGDVLYSGGDEGSIQVWSTTTGQQLQRIRLCEAD